LSTVPRNRTLRLAALGSTVQRAAAPGYASARSAHALRRRLVAGVLVALSLALITGYFRESESGALHDVQGVAASVLHPFQVGAERVARPFQDAYGWLAGFFHAKSENERLKAQLRLLEIQAIQNATAAQENVDLRKALKYKAGPTFPRGYELIGARVTSHAPNEFRQELGISAGRDDGLRIYDPVVDADGHLVGHVAKLNGSTALVTLLTDPSFAVSGYDVQTRTYGLVKHGEGGGETLILDLVPKDKVVRENDMIVTAGRRSGELSSLYPRDIAIGTVTSVGHTDVDIHQSVQIEPLADFSSLSSVWVLVRKGR
jgi:rod shape-determining protein MreC